MPYVMAGAISGLSQGILAAMERRLQREQMEQERLLRERQLELLAQQNAPVDLTNLFQLAGVQTDQPVLLPPQVAGPVVSAAAGRLFAPPGPDTPTIPSQAAEALGAPWLAGQPADVWMPVIREAASRAFTPQPPQAQMVDLGRFDPTLAGIQVPAEQVLDNLHRLRPDVNWETQPIPQEMAQAMGMPWLAGQAMGSLPALGGFMRDVASARRTQEETRWIGPRTEAEIRQTLAAAGLDEARTNEILATLPHTIENLRANTELTQALRNLREEEGVTEAQMRDASIRRIEAEIARMDAETQRIWELLPYQVKQMVAETLRTEAQAYQLQAETEHQQLQTQLLRQFGAAERQAALDAQLVATERARVELERERQLVEPIVRKALAEADVAERTAETMVQKVRQELENLYLQGQLTLEELERARQLTPLIVQEQQERVAGMQVAREQAEHDLDISRRYAAQEREANIRRILADAELTEAETARTRVDTRIREAERQYVEATLGDRIGQVMLQRQLLQTQLQQAEVALQQAQVQLAMSQRLGGYNEEQARLEVQRLQEQIAHLRAQTRLLEMEAQNFGSINPQDPDALLRLYEADTRQFRDAGLWVPPYEDYVEFVRSGGGDWAAEVAAYNEAATALLGPARVDDRGMTAKDHMQLARAMYEARYWLGGPGTPDFEEFLWTEYWPAYESMQYLLDPDAFDTGDYVFDPVLEATLFLEARGGNVDEAIRVMEENMDQIVRSGSLTREQAEQILDVLRREKQARAGKADEEAGFLQRIWKWLFRRGE